MYYKELVAGRGVLFCDFSATLFSEELRFWFSFYGRDSICVYVIPSLHSAHSHAPKRANDAARGRRDVHRDPQFARSGLPAPLGRAPPLGLASGGRREHGRGE